MFRPQAMQTQIVAGFLFLRCSWQPPLSSLVPRTLASASLKKFHEHKNVNIFLHYYDLRFDEAVLMLKKKTVTCTTDESKGKQ